MKIEREKRSLIGKSFGEYNFESKYEFISISVTAERRTDMIVINKKAVIHAKSDVISEVKTLLNTKDVPRIQKWICHSVRNSEYVESQNGKHIVKWNKYLFEIEQGGSNSFRVKKVYLEENEIEETPEVDRKQSSQTYQFSKFVDITDHALQEVINDFPEIETKSDAYKWVSQMIHKSELIDNKITGDDGKCRMMFGIDNIVFIVEEQEENYTVITVYKQGKQNGYVKNLIKDFLNKELQKLGKLEEKIEKKNKLRIAELRLERAECELKILKTNSVSIRSSRVARISAIDIEIEELQNEINETKRAKRLVAKGIVSYA